MPQSDNIERKKNQQISWIKKPQSIGWLLTSLFIIVGTGILTAIALRYRQQDVFPAWISFLSGSILNLLLFTVVVIQAYIYRRQWEIMHRQVQIMGIAVEPRLRIANVRATNFAVGGLPVFIVSLINEGAIEARDVTIKLQLQKGDAPPIFWTRQQNVTIPANGREDYPVRWPSVLRREDIDGFNDNVALRVLGHFIHENTTVEFCYRYYPWPFGNRPDGLPQFFPCGFDPGLTVPLEAIAGTFALTGAAVGVATIKAEQSQEQGKQPNEADPLDETPN
jgi:hypothetical protein